MALFRSTNSPKNGEMSDMKHINVGWMSAAHPAMVNVLLDAPRLSGLAINPD